jgi:hypothetical protein
MSRPDSDHDCRKRYKKCHEDERAVRSLGAFFSLGAIWITLAVALFSVCIPEDGNVSPNTNDTIHVILS